MSSIGSGPGITGHIDISGVRAVGAEARVTQAQANPEKPKAAATPQPEATMVSTTTPTAGQPPVDSERVTQIRKAIETGTYPVLPTKISDAMIAAGIMLQVRN